MEIRQIIRSRRNTIHLGVYDCGKRKDIPLIFDIPTL
jgi:hypothetical protein